MFLKCGIFFSILISPSFALAYVDPNAGSMILQLILAGVGGLLILVKIFWKKITETVQSLFKWKK